MKQEQLISLVRHILSGVGAYLIGKGIMNESIVLNVSGSILTLISVGWSIANKDFTVNKIEGTVRQLLTTASLFIAAISPQVIVEITAFIGGLLSIILGQTSKLKTVPEGAENK